MKHILLVFLLIKLIWLGMSQATADYEEDIVFAKVVSCAKCKLRDNPEVRAFIFEDLDR